MNSCKQKLVIGMVEFGDPTLLMSGDEDSLLWLASQLQKRESLRLADSRAVKLVNVDVYLNASDSDTEINEIDGKIEWNVSPGDAHTFADQLRALANSESPGHLYFDALNKQSVQVMVSKGEYTDTVFEG